MKKNNPPMIPAMTTTPITTPAAIPAVLGLLDGSFDEVGLVEAVELAVSMGALVDVDLVEVVEIILVLDEAGVAVGMLRATPLS